MSCFMTFFLLILRHHTNPVGTEWKWKMDDPDTIVNGAMENHRNMIKQFRGSAECCQITTVIVLAERKYFYR